MPTGSGLLNYAEAADFLGVAENTLRHWVSAKSIGFYKIFKRVYFKPAELQSWIEARKIEPVA